MKLIQENVDITCLSNFRTGASSKYFFELQSRQDIDKLVDVFVWLEKEDIPYLLIGSGTNMLFGFEEYQGCIIKNSLSGWTYNQDTKILETASGESIWEIASTLEQKYNQPLWHRFIGLPGSVGGAIFGNAGCFGLETENNFVSVEVFDILEKKVRILTKEEMDFSYRNSHIKKRGKYIILSAVFDLSEKKEKYHSDVDNIYFREHKQPKGNSCGSFFKNPNIDPEEFFEKFPEYREEGLKKISAGFLLEKVGLKGYHHGSAFFSEKHANFLMTENEHASSKDVLALIEKAQTEVYKKFGIQLQNEVQIITQ